MSEHYFHPEPLRPKPQSTLVEYERVPRDGLTVDLSKTIADFAASEQEVESALGFKGRVVAEIQASGKLFAVVRTEFADETPVTLLIGQDEHEQLTLEPHLPAIIGSNNAETFHLPASVEAEHFAVMVDDDSQTLRVADLSTKNSTSVTAYIYASKAFDEGPVIGGIHTRQLHD